jgi:acyl-CoA synthetase (AMP-forming)/AMP-acid ligase II/acyl carrier protein
MEGIMSTESDTIAPRIERVQASTLIDVLRGRAENEADRLAFRLASGDDSHVGSLTYGDLDLRARAIAVSLRSVASPGDRALLVFHTGLDFIAAFFGCLYAGLVAVPIIPPRPNRGLARLERILEDSGAEVVLTSGRATSDAAAGWSFPGKWASLRRLETDGAEPRLAGRWQPPSVGSDDLAYLQYTSGSTSDPRGVMVSHANLLYNCNSMRESLGLSQRTVSATWLPHFHDLGLIEGLINPLYTGYQAVLIPPAQFVGRPIRWLQAITKFRITHTGGPNFAYDLCVRKVKPEQRVDLDLSSWAVAYSGAEPVRRATLDRFAEYFAPCGFDARSFVPSYGLAEATLMVSTGWTERAGTPRATVSCGRAQKDTRIEIVDPETCRILPEGAEGEIWVSGPTVTRGYWNRPTETRATFEAHTSDTGEGPFLRTGDLGFLEGGALTVTGRRKDLIIIRGRNYHPQDIEWRVGEAHDALRPGFGAAFSVAIDDEERLVVAHEIERRHRSADSPELESIARAVREAVAREFAIQVYAVLLLNVGSIPMTPSGKIQRYLCRADFLAGRFEALWESRWESDGTASGEEDGVKRESLAAMSPRMRRLALEEHLCRHIARGLRVPWREIDPRRSLGSYGLESVKGLELITRLEDDLGIRLPASTLFNHPSVAELTSELLRLIRIDAAELSGHRGEDEGRSAP